jgi:hypothetical protein
MSGGPELRRDVGPVRDWYAATVARLDTLTAGEVVYSWRARFRPTGSVDDSGAWHRHPESEAGPVPYDGPRPDLFPDGSFATLEPGPGGIVLRKPDGSVVVDREAARRGRRQGGFSGPEQLTDYLVAMMGSGHRPAARKGSTPADVARSLAWESVRLRVGSREAARAVILWDDELSAPGRDPPAAELVRAKSLNAVDRAAREAAERKLMRSCHRVLVKLRIEDARRIC